MKTKKLPLLLTSLVALTGCGNFFKEKTEEIAIKVAMNLPFIVNVIDLNDQSLQTLDPLPNTVGRRKSLQYVKHAIAIPQSVLVEEYGLKATFTYDINYSVGADVFISALATISQDGIDVSANGLLPLGQGDFDIKNTIEGISDINELINKITEPGSISTKDIIKATKQETVELDISVTGTIGKSSATKKFYFAINPVSLDDLLATFNIDVASLGLDQSLIDLLDEWTTTPPDFITDAVNDNWPTSKPDNITSENWPESLPSEWIEEGGWPTTEEINSYIDENWPEEFPEEILDNLPEDLDFENMSDEDISAFLDLIGGIV